MSIDLFDQTDEVIESYMERATNILVESAWLPFDEDVWATDKYDDVIADKAQSLYQKENQPTKEE